ncbi:MAG: hypothetical protein VW547_06325 [Alphaproteobacteria bacterium]
MSTIDVTRWSKRNLWPLASGDLAVRPGIRRLLAPDNGRKLVGGFSVKNGYTDETWHYVFDVATTGVKDLRMRIYDEEFQIFQALTFGDDVDPRAITHAVVHDEILICSPDFASRWGLVGSGVILAETVASDSGSTALDVPRGICVAIGNRAVVFDGRTMYASDPVSIEGGTIRSFIAENANQRPGVVYGAHEGAGGSLVCVTSAGVYGLSAEAFAVGVVGSNGTSWDMLNHHRAYSYESSCAVRGRVWALSQDGVMLVDTENDASLPLDESIMTRGIGGARIFSEDWRAARMYAGDSGPMVAYDARDALHMLDLNSKIASWWTSAYAASNFKVRGVLEDGDGDRLLICENGVFAVDGDFDGNAALTVVGDPVGVFAGRLVGSPAQNRDVMSVEVMAARGGGSTSELKVAVRGKVYSEQPIVDPEGFQIGTTDWASTEQRLTSTPLAAVQFKIGKEAARPTREPTIEVGVTGALARVGVSIEVKESGSAPERPQKVG